MSRNFEVEILELMGKYDEDYDKALERYNKRQRLVELAQDRALAHEIKARLAHSKQKAFRKAAHPDLPEFE